MDKITLEFKVPSEEALIHNGVEFKVTPYLDVTAQAGLINRYLSDYFTKFEKSLSPGLEYNYLEAEFNLRSFILQSCTNLDTDTVGMDLYVDDRFWNKVFSSIQNYAGFRERLDKSVKMAEEQAERSLSAGVVLSEIMGKAMEILNKISNITPEEIAKIQASSEGLLDKLKESSILKDATR